MKYVGATFIRNASVWIYVTAIFTDLLISMKRGKGYFSLGMNDNGLGHVGCKKVL
jgi:hypothetical protein